ncbi:hypothetical protein [Phenylobacterium sp.]|uniref:hypothetical protein n=1 Tax=Phenylobacterium sp. TaxID=1871053 RepID=UPI00289F11CD|nr:hypothetical protein [Phenylobacterium sp.]
MQTLTEIVAAVVVSSSAAAYSHFGVALDAQQVEKPAPAERTIARTTSRNTAAAPAPRVVVKVGKSPGLAREICPETRARTLRI